MAEVEEDMEFSPYTVVVCSLKEGFIVGGILLGYLASALWVSDTGGWRNMYGVALFPAITVLAGMVRPSSTLSSFSSSSSFALTDASCMFSLFGTLLSIDDD